jgi:phosphoglycerate dehydrogenase-like enzyme
MTKPKPVLYICSGIVLSEKLFYEGCDDHIKIKDAAPGYDVLIGSGKAIADEVIERIEILLGNPEISLLKRMPGLKWHNLGTAGSERYCNKELYANDDIVLTNSSGVFGKPMSEYVIGMFIALSRNMHLYRDNMQRGSWERHRLAADIEGSTVGVIGLGDIGANVAKKAHALGVRVLAVKNSISEKPDYVDELYTADGLDHVLAQSDFISLSLPSTKDTQHFITERHFGLMKKNAIIVNVGRGAAIDQDALLDALREEKIFAAGLDVTSPEPLPSDHPLWKERRCLITPHNSADSYGNLKRIIDIFTENLHRYISGEHLKNIVNMERGY